MRKPESPRDVLDYVLDCINQSDPDDTAPDGAILDEYFYNPTEPHVRLRFGEKWFLCRIEEAPPE